MPVHDVPWDWRLALRRAGWLALGWGALTGGDPRGLGAGVFAVGLATALSLALGPPAPGRWRPLGLAAFFAAFALGSLRGGVDVALRALAPRPSLAPAVIEHPLRLPDGPAQNLFVGALSLMPGTLAVEVSDATLRVHVLVDRGASVQRSLAKLEALAARTCSAPTEDGDG